MRRYLVLLLAAVELSFGQSIAVAHTDGGSRSMIRSVTMDDGLPSNGVRCIVQDKQGYIWFGSDNGLCRYDGYGVQKYYNPNLNLNQYVSALAVCDDGLLVGSSKGIYLLSFLTGKFTLLDESITSSISDVAVDTERNVWVSTTDKGIFRYNLTSHECRNYAVKSSRGKVDCLLVDVNNQVWALSNQARGSLLRLNKANDIFEIFPLKDTNANIGGMAMLANTDGSILVGSWNQGLFQVSADGSSQLLIDESISHVTTHIHKLLYDSNQNVLVASDDGLLEYNMKSHSWRMLSEVDNPVRKNTERFVYGLAMDSEGGLWIGTFYGGVSYIPSDKFLHRFQAYYAGRSGLQGNVVGRFAEDSQRRVWIATDDAGLECYDPSIKKFLNYPGQAKMQRYNVHALLNDGNDLWVGTYANGLIRLNISSGFQQVFQLDGKMAGSSCYEIFHDGKHRLWATSMTKVNLWDDKKQIFRPVKDFKSLTIDAKEDKYGNVWFATQSTGLWCYTKDNKWKQYVHVEDDSASLLCNQVNNLVVCSNGKLIVVTSNGLCEYDDATGKFRLVEIEAPVHDYVCALEYQGTFWISTDNGILKYVPGEPVRIFNRYDGLTSNQFLPSSGLLASDGCMYFGTSMGFNAFYPYQVAVNQVAPPVAITSFQLFNKQLEVESEELPKPLNHEDKLDLSYDDNVLNISFAALSYVSPEKNIYMYKMEGFDKNWITTEEHRATYSNLPAGNYTFRVKATNNDGVWSKGEASLKVEVHPPFWWSLPAKILYFFVIGGLVWLYSQSRLKREKVRYKRDLERLAEKKEQEVRDARLQFFTMIAHEIRTPVTLIIGPLESLKEQWLNWGHKFAAGEEISQTLDVIDRNAQRLLLLVNQLLDFNKVQQKGVQMHFKLQNIARLMHAVAERFEPTFRQKGIRFEVEYPADDFSAVIDNEAITKVLSNLLTNATKYTKDYVKLSCKVLPNGMNFNFEVEDNGEGICPDDQEKIFSAFYQARDNKPGTGIGLSIVKNLVEAHHGMVEVNSKVGMGACFVVTLPVEQPDVAVEANDEKAAPRVLAQDSLGILSTMDEDTATDSFLPGVGQASALPGMLIVDDDEDMRNFVKSHFAKAFSVFTAENGKEALQVLREHLVSVIISDWMMPEMDGPEFCRLVRKDQNISHLPFVMLTAKTDNDSKTEGMNCGADMYIEKPFSMKYLDASVRNLLEMRRLLKEKFSHSPLEPIQEIAPTKMDNNFLGKMSKIIEENLANPELNVAFLASQLCMSRSSLFNKIRGLADVTPNEMIQLVRLKKAARLLKEGDYRISEVGYMVGFSSPSYFSKCFQKQFGMKPAEFVEMK